MNKNQLENNKMKKLKKRKYYKKFKYQIKKAHKNYLQNYQ